MSLTEICVSGRQRKTTPILQSHLAPDCPGCKPNDSSNPNCNLN